MAEIVIYSKSWCPYCQRAKALLTAKGVAFTDIDIEEHPDRRPEMIDKAGGRSSVPQIFINGKHVGGCDDLMALEARQGLDPLLAA